MNNCNYTPIRFRHYSHLYRFSDILKKKSEIHSDTYFSLYFFDKHTNNYHLEQISMQYHWGPKTALTIHGPLYRASDDLTD